MLLDRALNVDEKGRERLVRERWDPNQLSTGSAVVAARTCCINEDIITPLHKTVVTEKGELNDEKLSMQRRQAR